MPEITLNSILGTVFNDIYHATGGAVQLATMENPKDPKELLVVAKNVKQKAVKETTFKPIAGDGITRKCTVKCDIPADDAYAVACGPSGGASGHTSNLIQQDEPEEEEADPIAEAEETVKTMMEKGLSVNDFANEDCDCLAAAFKTLVDKASSEKVSEFPHDKHVWPLELEIEIDGTEGFRFGDVVGSDFMPQSYRKAGIGPKFVCIEATHTIANGDWSTSLKTQCYLGK